MASAVDCGEPYNSRMQKGITLLDERLAGHQLLEAAKKSVAGGGVESRTDAEPSLGWNSIVISRGYL